MLIENGVIHPALIKLAQLQGLTAAGYIPNEALSELLQRDWVGTKGGKTRAQLEGRFPNEEELSLFRELEMAGALPINFTKPYLGILFLCATIKAMARRLMFLRKERLRMGEDFPTVYFLTSERPLDETQEMPEHIPAILEETGLTLGDGWKSRSRADWPKTEHEAIHDLVDWTCGLDQMFGRAFVSAGLVTQKEGLPSRHANTGETAIAWAEKSKSGNYLVLSSQPYCQNQRLAVERATRAHGESRFTFDVCGPAAPSTIKLSQYLDNAAKQLWEEMKLLEKV